MYRFTCNKPLWLQILSRVGDFSAQLMATAKTVRQKQKRKSEISSVPQNYRIGDNVEMNVSLHDLWQEFICIFPFVNKLVIIVTFISRRILEFRHEIIRLRGGRRVRLARADTWERKKSLQFIRGRNTFQLLLS